MTTSRPLHIGQPVRIASNYGGEFANLPALIVWAPDENNAGTTIRIDSPGHELHGWIAGIDAEHLENRA